MWYMFCPGWVDAQGWFSIIMPELCNQSCSKISSHQCTHKAITAPRHFRRSTFCNIVQNGEMSLASDGGGGSLHRRQSKDFTGRKICCESCLWGVTLWLWASLSARWQYSVKSAMTHVKQLARRGCDQHWCLTPPPQRPSARLGHPMTGKGLSSSGVGMTAQRDALEWLLPVSHGHTLLFPLSTSLP